MIDCLVQKNKSESCGDCTLCWSSRKPIKFENHAHKVIDKDSKTAHIGVTMYGKNVFDLKDYKFKVIKPSTNQKLGKKILRGKFKGAKIYTVTLEERATCFRGCEHWLDCYGNNMPFAHRIKVGASLIPRLNHELNVIDKKNKPYTIRLHVLGDFYSVEYVKFWIDQLNKRPLLSIYGYTRWHIGTDIGDRIAMHNHDPRFAIRFSNAKDGFRAVS